ncbi:MAG: DNA polymerase III delta prime subunit [Thermoproteota archaeon]|jgi:DNA polymerase III delta prime subunit
MDEITKILQEKNAQDQLAHFYMVGTTPNQKLDSKIAMDQWLQTFLKTIHNLKSDSAIFNHPDILIIGRQNDTYIELNEDKEKAQLVSKINVDDFNPINKFLAHKPLEFKSKFIIIYNAHLISVIAFNKLLKTLEEPGEYTSIFLLNPINKKLLATIHSRAIHLKVNLFKKEDLYKLALIKSDQYNFKELIKNTSLHQFIDKYKDKEADILKAYLFYLQKSNDMTELQNGIEQLKWFELSKTMNNSTAQRLYTLHNNKLHHL